MCTFNGSFNIRHLYFQVCQTFVFCALLEFALVNYASRSDMQRDRARERMERARRQWELENAEMEAHDAATAAAAAAAAAGGTTTEAATTSSAAGVAASTTSTTTAAATAAVSTSSTVTGSTPAAISTKANGNPRAVSANHITADGPSAFTLVSLALV